MFSYAITIVIGMLFFGTVLAMPAADAEPLGATEGKLEASFSSHLTILHALTLLSPSFGSCAGLILARGVAGDCYNPVSKNCLGEKSDIGLNTFFKCSSMQINGGKYLCGSCNDPVSKCKKIDAYNCHANIQGCIKSN